MSFRISLASRRLLETWIMLLFFLRFKTSFFRFPRSSRTFHRHSGREDNDWIFIFEQTVPLNLEQRHSIKSSSLGIHRAMSRGSWGTVTCSLDQGRSVLIWPPQPTRPRWRLRTDCSYDTVQVVWTRSRPTSSQCTRRLRRRSPTLDCTDLWRGRNRAPLDLQSSQQNSGRRPGRQHLLLGQPADMKKKKEDNNDSVVFRCIIFMEDWKCQNQK